MSIDGILNLDKPKGKTSFEMVALVRRLSGERRVGHAGTLDPIATGVLPICLGQGTRLAEFLIEGNKVYRAEIELGITTDTYDAAGTVTRRDDTSALTREQIETALASFTGSIEQLPPIYSALKHQGKPLYRWARAGVEVPRKTRKVEVHHIEVISCQLPLLILELECGRGTYVRSLAHDLGQKLGCGAHLRNLVRLRSGPFDISSGISVSRIEDAFKRGYWLELIHPIDTAVLHLPVVTLDNDNVRAVANGNPLVLEREDVPSAQQGRAYSEDGRFIALLRYDEGKGWWQPYKVFATKP